jgi:DNA polymerase-3 subunit delta'
MALKDIIGQERALGILRGCIAKDRIPHAMLFAGDEGIGKRLAALNFAKTLNCQKKDSASPLLFDKTRDSNNLDANQIDACDKCPSCLKIDKESHPDVSIIAPEGEGGQITVSSIRQLEESLSYKPFEGKWKVAIIDNADRLNPSAANAFLQTLEEPSEQSVLILISSRPDMILPTIRSRCQRINFAPLPTETMSILLEEKFGKSDHDKLELLSILSGGRPGYALNENLIAQRDWSFELFKQMLERVEEDMVWEDRESMEEWFEWAQLLLRDIAVFKATEQKDLLINKDRAHEIEKIAERVILKDILKLARELYNIKESLNYNLNKQLTLNYTSLLLKKMLNKIT